jgi:hypothetical protein
MLIPKQGATKSHSENKEIIIVPKKFEIPNGIQGANRDINLKLSLFLDEPEIRQLFSISQQYFMWKDSTIFKVLHALPNMLLLTGDSTVNTRFNSEYLIRNANIFSIKRLKYCFVLLNTPMINLRKYLLKLKVLSPKMEIMVTDKFKQYAVCNAYFEKIGIFFTEDKPIEWKLNDKLVFVVDTSRRILMCGVNSKRVILSYTFTNPIYFVFFLHVHDSVQILSFRIRKI